jgi:hypothetical protein
MPMRYFFNIRDRELLISDEEGTELANLAAARAEARLSARDLAMDDLRGGRAVAPLAIEITDGSGAVLETLQVRDVMA